MANTNPLDSFKKVQSSSSSSSSSGGDDDDDLLNFASHQMFVKDEEVKKKNNNTTTTTTTTSSSTTLSHTPPILPLQHHYNDNDTLHKSSTPSTTPPPPLFNNRSTTNTTISNEKKLISSNDDSISSPVHSKKGQPYLINSLTKIDHLSLLSPPTTTTTTTTTSTAHQHHPLPPTTTTTTTTTTKTNTTTTTTNQLKDVDADMMTEESYDNFDHDDTDVTQFIRPQKKRMLPLWMDKPPQPITTVGGLGGAVRRHSSSCCNNNNYNTDSIFTSILDDENEKNLLIACEEKRRKKEQLSTSSSSNISNSNDNNNKDEEEKKDDNEEPKWLTEMRGFTEIEEPIASGRVICFDLETTGFGGDDSIIEIGAVELINGCRTGLTFQSYAKPKASIHREAAKVHNLNAYLLNSAPPIEFVLASFMDFVGDALLVAHNLAFDHRMLIQEMMRSKIPVDRSKKCFCTMKYYRKVYKDVSYNLDSISQQLQINKLLLRRTHGALVDSEILAIIYSHLTRIPPNYATLKLIDKMNQAPWKKDNEQRQQQQQQEDQQQQQQQQTNVNNNNIKLPSDKLDLNNVYNHNSPTPSLSFSSSFNTNINSNSNNTDANTNSNTNSSNNLLERLDHFVLTTKDLDKCLEFYCNVVGLEKEIRKVQDTVRISLRINETQKINIHVQGKEFKPFAKHPTPGSLDLCFISRNPILQVIQKMFQHNIPIEEGPIPRTGACGPILSIYVRDPDGNLIEISEKMNA